MLFLDGTKHCCGRVGGGDEERERGMRNLTTDQNNSPMATAFGSDKVIDRKTLKPFVKRDDRHGLINLAGHGAALGATG